MDKLKKVSSSPVLVDRYEEKTNDGYHQWSVSNNIYRSTGMVVKTLPPDLYKPYFDQHGPGFTRLNFSTEDIFRFTDSNLNKVVSYVEGFWAFKDRFKKFGFPHRRGILLYGPPGAGKTCAIKLVLKDVIENGGIALQFEDASVFNGAMTVFRRVQPETPVVVVMEDLDALLSAHEESVILNLLDGVSGFEHIVYLATTNYPEELDPRIKNRPSRFDRRFEIGLPSLATRNEYIRLLSQKVNGLSIDIDDWAEKTDKLTLAHIKDLFISVVLYEQDYEETLSILKEMGKKISSSDFEGSRSGFARE